MRIKRVFLFAFLLMLYIAPLFLSLSYSHTAIPTHQNTVKEFSPAAVDWLDATWKKRKIVWIEGSDGAGTDYQFLLSVPWDSDMQPDFDDLRFTDENGTLLLDYWIESYVASTSALVWIEVSDDLSVTQDYTDIYMYYGNAAASDASDGDATFLFFDDFSTLDSDKWSWSGASVSGGELVLTANEWIKSDDTFDSSTAFEARSKQAFSSRHNFGYGAAVPFVGAQWIQHNWDGDAFMFEGNLDTGTLAYPDGVYCIQSLYWKDGDEGAYDIDRSSQETRTDTDIPDSDMYVGIQLWGSSGTTYYADWCFLRNWIPTEPSFVSFGSEEDEPSVWQTVNDDLIFIIDVSDDPVLIWGLDVFLILAGGILIPTSTVYLVYGGRDKFSSDKLLIFLLLFMVGLGLLIGGVMP